MSLSTMREYEQILKDAIDALNLDDVKIMVDEMWRAVREGKAIYTMGNGGHCNTASHMINDIAKHTVSSDDKSEVVTDLRFRTMCFNDSMSFVTGITNDMGFGDVFAEQVKNWVEQGDIVLGVTGSGNSANILKAFEEAKARGAFTIALTGFSGGKSKAVADLCIVVPCQKMVVIEDVHLMINHMVADELKRLVQDRKVLIG